MRSHLVSLSLLASPLAAQQSVTIYNDGRILMRSVVPSQVPSGNSTHRVSGGFLDAGSVFSLDSAVAIMGASYDAAVDEANTLRRAIGRKLVFETYVKDGVMQTVEAEVLGVEPELYRLPDGTLSFQRPGRARYPADLVLVAPTLSLSVRSTNSRDALRLGWFTDGGSWNANYAVILGRGTARISGQAEIQSGRLTVQNGEVQLLAGEVGRAPAAPMELEQRVARQSMAMAKMADQSASEQGIGESHLYTIPGTLTIRPGTSTVASLFDPATTTWTRRYVVRGQLPWYGPLPQYGEEEKPPVEVQYNLKRALKTTFGDAPLPAGTWRLYEADAGGRPQLIGEAGGQHTAAGQDVKLWGGNAFDLTAERVQTEYTTSRVNNRTIANAAYRVTVSNAKDSVVTVEVIEDRRGEWSLVDSSLPGEKVSSTETRFRLQVPAKGQATLTYRVRVVW
jgi:hypothetical protein